MYLCGILAHCKLPFYVSVSKPSLHTKCMYFGYDRRHGTTMLNKGLLLFFKYNYNRYSSHKVGFSGMCDDWRSC